jgi:hypothetical protein
MAEQGMKNSIQQKLVESGAAACDALTAHLKDARLQRVLRCDARVYLPHASVWWPGVCRTLTLGSCLPQASTMS